MKIRRFSPKQRKVLTWWVRDNYHEAIICDGAVRSGKTLCMGISFVCWAMRCFDRRQFGLCGKSIISLRRNVLSELLPYLRQLGFQCLEKRSENLILIRHGSRENRFYLFGGYDESSAALIQGITFAGVLLDEVALMPRSFVEQACARCSVSGSRLWFSCNPEGPQHWFYQEWILKSRERHALYLHFTMEDNPALSERIRVRYRNSYSGIFYRRFVLGEWTAAQGLIYDFFEPESCCVPPPEGEMERYCISVDYGTANPTSCGFWGLRNNVWYRLREYYYNSRKEGCQKTDAEYVEAIRALADGRPLAAVLVDPSAASFIEALRREGFSVERAKNDVADGIRVTADLLKRKRIVICDTCGDCIREMGLYTWDERMGHDAPKKENDHAMDDMRYFAMWVRKQEEGGFAATYVER
ncbi:PBSX family phage terminase large subunit [Oscillibacter sp. MSJ-2]|uniref:PBSX family phage terminase large subunit n=1 Tax=Dysosmobacter acutus TaxID=2841504 RepID=A0ABS6F7K2_9FIRM|nr:PBSX family phage terminase large subunit [Dysosmobacter acutus]MBU5626256.1 PBSX family phage terminase large subunit [Dysosmobacter acutus]